MTKYMWHVFHVHAFPRVFLEASVSISVTELFHMVLESFFGGADGVGRCSVRQVLLGGAQKSSTARNPNPGFQMSDFSCINVIFVSTTEREFSAVPGEIWSLSAEYIKSLELRELEIEHTEPLSRIWEIMESPRRAKRQEKFENSDPSNFQKRREIISKHSGL